jgi:hypothetical protein
MMKSMLVWVAILAMVFLALKYIPAGAAVQEIPFSTFMTEGVSGKYKSDGKLGNIGLA